MKKSMKVLYICFADFSRADSGSSVRPQKMYKAFLERGHEVKLLCGSDGNDCRKERKKNVAEINSWLNSEKPDICYIESPTGAIMLDCDIRLIKRIHRMGIPIGYFMRDFHSKFPEIFPRRKGFVNSLKDLYLDIRQKKTFAVLNNVDIVYLPCDETKVLFDYPDMRALPPAGENHWIDKRKFRYTAIYVGGISQHYSLGELLDAYTVLNENEEKYRLILCARKNEWESFEHPHKNASWLEVHHASGEALAALYSSADIGLLIPKAGSAYNDVTLSVKIFEYMSYGLPIVAAHCVAMDNVINKYSIGITTKSAPHEFANAIKKMFDDKMKYDAFRANEKTALLNENLWVHRVDAIIDDLSKKAGRPLYYDV